MRCGHATQQGIKQSLVKLNHLRYSIVRSKKIEFDCLFTCSTKGELTQALCSAALSTFYLWEKVRTIRIKSAGYEMIKHDTVSWNYMELWQHSYKPSITHSSGPVCISCDCGFLDKGTLRTERNETKQKKSQMFANGIVPRPQSTYAAANRKLSPAADPLEGQPG